ncbi:MAG: hypothetical protein HYV77_01695 [Candidatus Wildermuthbacteria bacterium]|nr:hypothetical protein [Candidatus Wildermuthbacteria bacterium]
MPIELRYSYRIIFFPTKDAGLYFAQKWKSVFPAANFIIPLMTMGREIKKNTAEITKILKIVYARERNGMFLRQKKSWQPRIISSSWINWLSKENAGADEKKIMESIFELSNGKTTLSDISLQMGIDMQIIWKAAEKMLRAGFLKEVAYLA